MLKINDLRAYVAELQETIPNIAENNVVIDDSQITKFCKEFTIEKEYILLGIIPKHKPKGTMGFLRMNNYTSLLVLRNVDRREQSHNDFLDVFAESQEVAEQITNKMLLDVEDDDYCGFLKYIVPSSLDINPIWGLAGCDGYQIDFMLDAPF